MCGKVEPVAWLGDEVDQKKGIWRDDRKFTTATQMAVRYAKVNGSSANPK